MKPKYSIGEQVRIKATGEKVKILAIWDRSYYKNSRKENQYYFGRWILESELKPYRPSRTGKYRNKRGQFVSKEYIDWLKEIDSHLKFERNPDSKQRNYQKKDQQWFDHDYIIKSLERIEKKIDELGRKI